MALLFLSHHHDPTTWSHELLRLMPELDIRVWPAVGREEDVDVALVWKPPQGVLRGFSQLKLIISLGMGIDHLLRDRTLPPQVPITRLVNNSIVTQIGAYVCWAVLQQHRSFTVYQQLQQRRRWQPLPLAYTTACPVGILGLGVLGRHTAKILLTLGFSVLGWSRRAKALENIQCFHGSQGLFEMLAQCSILVCLLPLTTATKGIMDATTLATLPQGAYIINCGRGAHLVEEDLLKALDQGHIAGATLDVFQQEPLPPEHPFWGHPKICVTPHIAGITDPYTAAPQVVENIRRMQTNQPLLNVVDRNLGY
jgi:glyoxylate/hydroxypyruvate reductase A